MEVVDTAFLIFRLWEICDGAAFPIANLNNLSEFERWNQIFHLIDTGKSFKRTREFDATKVEDLTQLEAVITIIKMKYQAILQNKATRYKLAALFLRVQLLQFALFEENKDYLIR